MIVGRPRRMILLRRPHRLRDDQRHHGPLHSRRAESFIGSCCVRFMERPERLVLVIIGALFNRMAPVLWVIAVLST